MGRAGGCGRPPAPLARPALALPTPAAPPDAGWRCAGALRASNRHGAPLQLRVAFDASSTHAALAGRFGAQVALERGRGQPHSPPSTCGDCRRMGAGAHRPGDDGCPLEPRHAGGALCWSLRRAAARCAEGPLQAARRGAGNGGCQHRRRRRGRRPRHPLIAALPTPRRSTSMASSAVASCSPAISYVALPGDADRAGSRGPARDRRVARARPRLARWRRPAGNCLAGLRHRRRADPDARGMRAATTLRRCACAYLSGWLGLAGLGELDLHGALQVAAEVDAAAGCRASMPGCRAWTSATPRSAVFDGLQGDLRYSRAPAVEAHSLRKWRQASMAWSSARHGCRSAPARTACCGSTRTRMPFMGGRLTVARRGRRPRGRFPPAPTSVPGWCSDVDFGRVSQVVGLPAFQGRLSGRS